MTDSLTSVDETISGYTRSTDMSAASLILPIRGEKRIIPMPSPYTKLLVGEQELQVQGTDYNLVAAKRTLTDYIYIRLFGRNLGADEDDPSDALVYRFLVNPKSIDVSYSTIDGMSMTRNGWQLGIFGEDIVSVTLSGQTAGQYFAEGLSSEYEELTASYRNLMDLVAVFENNGYFFEGEDENPSAFANDLQRRKIQGHHDVELVVGNFIWRGAFSHMTVIDSADTPYATNFNLTFMAWKERYRSESPWLNSIENGVYRGHAMEKFISALSTESKREGQFGVASTEQAEGESDSGSSDAFNPAQSFIDDALDAETGTVRV